MKPRRLGVACVAALTAACMSWPLRASPTCVSVPGIAGAIELFLRRVGDAQSEGAATLSVQDVLIGVTGISAADRRALAARGPVVLTKRGDGFGVFSNSGPRPVEISGIFAATATFFKIPKAVNGTYRWSSRQVTFFYDRRQAVEVGEKFLGITFFRVLDHSVVSHGRLSFFFANDTSQQPDRCYVAAAG